MSLIGEAVEIRTIQSHDLFECSFFPGRLGLSMEHLISIYHDIYWFTYRNISHASLLNAFILRKSLKPLIKK